MYSTRHRQSNLFWQTRRSCDLVSRAMPCPRALGGERNSKIDNSNNSNTSCFTNDNSNTNNDNDNNNNDRDSSSNDNNDNSIING